jgi:hypothetical protein
MITVFIYGNSNNKHQLLRKTQVSVNCKGIVKGRIDLPWFQNFAKTLEPNMTSVWVQK